MNDSPIKKRPALLLLAALVLLVFGPALRNGFVYDDHALVERNPVVRTLNPATHLGADFWSRQDSPVAYYRPAVTWSLALDRALFGAAPWGHHLTNLVVHALSVLLLFTMLNRFGEPRAAWLGAAIFAVHPIQAEAVTWIVGRTDLLACLFVLLAARFHLAVGQKPGRRDLPSLTLAVAAFLAALLSKETGAAFLAVAFAADLARRRVEGGEWREALRTAAGRALRLGPVYLAALVGYLALRYAMVGQLLAPGEEAGDDPLNPLAGAPPAARLLTAIVVAGRYLVLVVWPRTLSVDYMADVVPLVRSALSPAFLLSLAGLPATLAAAALLARKRPPALFGLLAAAGAWLLVSHLLVPLPVVMAERFFYLPMIGLSVLLASALLFAVERLSPAAARKRAALAVGLLLVSLLGARSLARTLDWKDDLTLFSSAVKATPRSVQSWHNLGFALAGRGESEQALQAYDRAVEIAPGFVPARLNRAGLLLELGRPADAEQAVREVIAEQPDSSAAALELVKILSLRAEALASAGNDEAARLLREELVSVARSWTAEGSEQPAGVRAVFLEAAARNLALLGREAEAGGLFGRAVAAAAREVAEGGAVKEASSGVQAMVLASAAEYHRAGRRWIEAARLFDDASGAARLAGQDEVSMRLSLNAGESWRKAGDTERALEAFRRAELEAGDETPLREEARAGVARANLDAAERALVEGRAPDALPLYDGLLQDDPGSSRARHGRARARLAMGDVASAEEDLERLLADRPSGRLAAVIWTDMALAAARRGDRDEAVRRLEVALQHEPDFPAANALLRELER